MAGDEVPNGRDELGRVNFNYINDKDFCEKEDITVLLKEEPNGEPHGGVESRQFDVQLSFGDYGQIKDEMDYVKDSSIYKAYIYNQMDYVIVDPKQLDGIREYVNARIYDYWDTDSHFEKKFDAFTQAIILKKNDTCEDLDKKLPPLEITLNIKPADNYY